MAKYRGIVLVVDDHAAARRFAAKVLGARGYLVLEAVGGTAALEMADAVDGRIDLLLSDVVMPGMNGDKLARSLRADYPDLRVIFMSGYDEDELAGMGVSGVGAAYITKPFTADVLTLMVEGALAR